MEYVFSVIIGYLFGSFNSASIISGLRGYDIKKIGTKNAGASNVFISVGKVYGVIVAVFDILKAFLAAEIAFLLFSESKELAVLSGVMAVVGHIFPFWMKFNGGKGLAPFMGIILFYDWKLFFILVFFIAAIILITDYIAIGALCVTAFMPIYTAIFKGEYLIGAFLLVLAALMWYKHKENIIRLKNGTEIGFRKKNKIKKEP